MPLPLEIDMEGSLYINLNESHLEIDLNDPPYEANASDFTNNETVPQEEELDHVQFDTCELLSSEDEEEALRNKSVKKIKMVTNEKRYAIYAALLQRSVNGKLKKKTTRDVASIFSVSIRTVQRIWKRSREHTEDGVANVSNRKTKNCGRKRIEIDMERFRSIPLQQRTNLRSTASAMNMSTSLIYNNTRRGKIRRHSNSLKPLLTDQNKKARLCMRYVIQEKGGNNYKILHIVKDALRRRGQLPLQIKCDAQLIQNALESDV
ncbi:hypothetical protein POM88_017652 [Heracleum sosnowskyi]|uniref:DUF7769 domain-containing protein n=1 Tax=Heracleum sosnowskyi TaxID=360622 RepID=A0AAD8IQW4_9APIA|nr:hypothetical protein POM88_017652 [Heracleum sosnowskyi]